MALVAFGLLALLAAGSPATAQLAPDPSGPAGKAFRHPDLDVQPRLTEAGAVRSPQRPLLDEDLAELGVSQSGAMLDTATGRWATLLPATPILPGKGVGNALEWGGLATGEPKDAHDLRMAAGRLFNAYLRANAVALRIDPSELAGAGHVTSHDDGALVQITVPRVHRGIPVRDSYVSAAISQGNLVLMGTHKWADIAIGTEPSLPVEAAWPVVEAQAAPYALAGTWGKSSLEIVTVRGEDGAGLGHRLVHVLRPTLKGDQGRWEALVDADTGELLAFEDTNQYAGREVTGGVYPVSNDGVAPDGVEQAGWPMPFDRVSTPGGTLTTDIGGNVPGAPVGNVTSNLAGQYVAINDNCGAISLTAAAGDVDFGTSSGTDCATPGFGGLGNTHSSRSGFFELNQIAAQGRSHLPGNGWLQSALTANMNLNSTCNAFWNGSVNFYRSGGGCNNTGEIAGVFDHEWGHGMDANDATPGISSNGGEGIADVYAALRLNDSCIGRNFRSTVCTGNGDPCLTCTGVRDIDWAKRQSGQPHTVTWINANCGGSVHCIGVGAAESVWDLYKRDLPALFGMDNNTALEVTTRLTYLGAGGVGIWFSGAGPFAGCGATSGYLNYLAADDDNGDLNDGTPHMSAIFAAFDRHEMACATPAVVDSGCAGTPAVGPVVSGTPFDKSVQLDWSAVAGASEYQVFRTDGVFACDFGKIKVGTTAVNSIVDSGLQNGRDYHYVVLPIGAHDTCMGPASACTTVAPAAGPGMDLVGDSESLAIGTGDGDAFIDNCEIATLTFDVVNSGLGALTNARIVGVTPTSHPTVTVLTAFPAALTPSSLAEGAIGQGSFDFAAEGLAPGDTLTFVIELVADEMTTSKLDSIGLPLAESDITHFASRTFTFEADAEGWQVDQGTFARATTGGGAQGTSWYEKSSESLHDQCDIVRSPIVQLTATSTLSVWNQYDIEPLYGGTTWYDRANVGIYQVGSGSRWSVNPDGGRLYNASGPGGTCGTNGQGGWADTEATWGESIWSAAALGAAGLAGTPVRLDVRYGTDFSIAGTGFLFDEVTLTDFDQQVADAQSDVCTPLCTVNADCDDGTFCNGEEICNAGICEPGTPPTCDDGVSCTVDSCDPGADACDNAPDDSFCDNGVFCDGAETCDAVSDCQPGSDPCPGQSCDEVSDVCVECLVDAECDNGLFCDGAEVCNAGVCEPGTPPVCDNGQFCDGTETCNETTDSCDAGTPVDCADGVSCTVDACNEGTDSCDNTPVDSLCDNGLFCDGTETCDVALDCQAGVPVDCGPGMVCNEDDDICEGGVTDTVVITQAKYKADKDELKIKATSSEHPDAVLEVVGYGTMTLKDDKYELKLKPVAPLPVPETVTVVSSYGGTATKTVMVR